MKGLFQYIRTFDDLSPSFLQFFVVVFDDNEIKVNQNLNLYCIAKVLKLILLHSLQGFDIVTSSNQVLKNKPLIVSLDLNKS